MTTRNCDNCNVAYGPDDVFCENCGYDFVTGSLPSEADEAPRGPTAAPAASPVAPSVLSEEEAGPSAGSGPTAGGEQSSGATGPSAVEAESAVGGMADVPRLTVIVSVDRGFFDQVVNDGEIDFPDPAPADQELVLAGTELHIGRTSESRAIHPDIDVAALTNDQAASSQHAVLRVADDGTLTVVDVGSTNGTFLDAVDSEAITKGIPFEVKPGTAIYVGAWTRLTIAE